jgi:peptide/nickel transport system permease protein
MKWARRLAIGFLLMLALACAAPSLFSHFDYAHQFRDLPDARPSAQHWLGTDDLGRDRFARVLYGTRVSLLLAPAAAFTASLLAALIGGVAGFLGGWVERLVMACTDLFLSLPWLFLLITVRALLPLNVSPLTSVVITFALLACLGWAAAARVVSTDARSLRNSEFILMARASGSGGFHLFFRHLMPNFLPILSAQFWISIPVFILAEANLGILGLGVSEPMPSWGSLLRELESYTALTSNPWQFVPLLLFIGVVSCFHILVSDRELPA